MAAFPAAAAARALRLLDPETAHGLAVAGLALGLGPRRPPAVDPILATRVAGLALPGPIGLAAGFDKDARAPDALLGLGFHFVECGTTTPRPQPGNPRPRMFRLSEDRGLINRLGFNNEGIERFAERLARRTGAGVVGANIGANKDSADPIGDYAAALTRLWGRCAYFTVNVSSPNTPGLRNLQFGGALDELLERLAEARCRLPAPDATPLFLKVAPDLDAGQIGHIADSAARHGADGLIVGNTTISRPAGLRSRLSGETGGLSGAPLMALSTAVLRQFRQAVAGRMPLIGVGGIASGADAYAKIRAGASAVQLYTAFAYAGPGLIESIARDLAARLRADGFAAVSEAVGAD